MKRETKKSWQQFYKTKDHLAGGSSTNSKVPLLKHDEPPLIARGKGCRVWDLDDNEYIDFRLGLGPVSLGYAVEEIDTAIIAQLQRGIIYGHPHPLEGEVARLLTEIIPCAEKARFLKTGGEAAAACIKIARSATGRSRIVQCGYNGWLNRLSPSAARPQPAGMSGVSPEHGTPAELARLHVSLPWGQLEAWESEFKANGKNTAAVVIASDCAAIERGADFLPAVRSLTNEYGTLMVMDEIVTGFRIAVGGVHEYFDFAPDLAVFAKGLANGMPLSTYVGRADLLDSALDLKISSTFGGETLSLAASRATLGFYRERDVIGHMWRMGKILQDGINELFERNCAGARLVGFPACATFRFPDNSTREAFFRNCYGEGVSLYDAVYISYSHTEKDIGEALARVQRAVERLSGGSAE